MGPYSSLLIKSKSCASIAKTVFLSFGPFNNVSRINFGILTPDESLYISWEAFSRLESGKQYNSYSEDIIRQITFITI